MTPEELSWFVDDTVARLLQGVPGVSEVRRMGGVEREIRIDLDPDRLLSFGVTAGDVNAQVRASNVNLAGGRGEIAGREQAIRTLASKVTVRELAATMVALPGGRKVRLDELGTVTDSIAEPRTFAKLDGEFIVAFSVSRAKGASDTVVAAAAAERLQEIAARYPEVSLQRIDNTVDYTMGVYEATMKTLLEGAVLAVIVVFLFLRDMRATVIAAVALPLSIVPAFWAMSAMDFSLNLVSLLAVTIVTGILVDDAIVEIENIDRHIHQGKSAWRAALEGADEIGLAVIATTLTIIAVFTPVSFMGGIAGQYFKQFGLVVSAAVFFSLLVARLITPMMSAYFMRPSAHAEKEGWMLRTYTRLVRWSVRHYVMTVMLGLLVFAGSVGSFFLLPSGFMPTEDSGRMLLGVELPPGSRLADTERTLDEIARRVTARPDVESAFALGGTLLGSGEEVRKATLIITLVPRSQRVLSQGAIREEVSRNLAGLSDIRYFFLQDDGQREFQLVVTGRDGEAVTRIAAELTSEAKRLNQLTNVVSTAELDRPELRIYPRSELAAELGITTETISEAVRIATIGDIGA
ncbi:MAG TPA: efflux RND transporter permease subunit, partial [Hyphomicrobium sp.]|nr:efflux RND transporter permease subunit [Hyphomicrobium sp.]